MRTALVATAFAALAACGAEEPPAGQNPPPVAENPPAVVQNPLESKPPPGQTVEQTRQAEKSAEQGKPLSSTSLTQIVRAALESESSLDARRIDIENRNGTIALHGQVDSEEQREKAGRIVGSVGGVTAVENRLTVSPSASVGASAGDSLKGGTLELPK